MPTLRPIDRRSKRGLQVLSGSRGWLAAAGLVGVLGVGGIAVRPERTAAPADAAAEEIVLTPMESVEAAANPKDANRFGVSTRWDLPNLNHPRVDYWTRRYTTDPELHDRMELFLKRSGTYRQMIARQLAERGMPQDLLFLSMIESGFSPRAFSPAKASGLWQFVSETGRRYGLSVDGSVDERNHPERATAAALDYLNDLHDRFDSWYLAAAAYNTGENRVARIMREEFGTEKAFGEGAYYRIWNRLPAETRDYVPLMIAAARMTKNPEKYGFDHVEPEAPLQYDEVVTDASMTFSQIASAANVNVDDVRLLNPYLKNGRTPGDRRVAVRLPEGASGAFELNWPRYVSKTTAKLPNAPRPTVHAPSYRVKRGDNLGAIAQKHGLSVAELKRLNGLKTNRIVEGQRLRVTG